MHYKEEILPLEIKSMLLQKNKYYHVILMVSFKVTSS